MSTAYVVQWDKTQKTWHVDISGVGRYSVRRSALRKAYAGYLNGELLTSVTQSSNVEEVKAAVAERIIEAKRIADIPPPPAPPAPDRRAEAVAAARGGIAAFLRSTRGAHMFGANSRIVETTKKGIDKPTGFCIVYDGDNRIYFDTTEM